MQNSFINKVTRVHKVRMLLKRGMGNGEWGMGNGKWGMGNGEWGMGNGEWEMGNGKLNLFLR